jgi:hypothetical protein
MKEDNPTNLCDGIKAVELNDSLETELIMIDIRNLHSAVTTSWETTLRSIQVAILELATFFIIIGVGGKLIPNYLPYVLLSLMFFIAVTYAFFSFRVILSQWFNIRRDVLACKLGKAEMLANSYREVTLAPLIVTFFFTLSGSDNDERFNENNAIFNDYIILGLFIVILFFSGFESMIFYFYLSLFINGLFIYIFLLLFFFFILTIFRLIPKIHYKTFGKAEKTLASRKYKFIYNLRNK